MAGLKREDPAAEEGRRVPKRGLESGTDESATKKRRININEDRPIHVYPLRPWDPVLGPANFEAPKQPNGAMKAPFALQEGWLMSDNTIRGFTHSEKTNVWGRLNSTDTQAQQTLSSRTNLGCTAGINPERNSNVLGVDDEVEVEVEDSGDEVEAVIAGVQHSLANPQPLVPPDWNQRIVDKKIKRGLRFIARNY